MFPQRLKKIALGLSVLLPFLIYCVIYYSEIFKDTSYRFSDFQSFSYQYGTGDSLINKYDSKTGNYQYLNNHDSLIKKHFYLTNAELMQLHFKAAYWGFWDFPDREVNDSAKARGVNSPHYLIQFNFKNKSKKVLYDAAFDGPPKLKDANEGMKAAIEEILNEAEKNEAQREALLKK